CFETSLVSKIDNDQKRKSTVKALEKTDIKLMVNAICEASGAKIEKNAPSNWYNGAPGGWPTSRLLAVVIYSPASQKLAVGSTVSQKVVREMANTSQPVILFHFVKLNEPISAYKF